jgi:hypothetical protein
MWSHPATAKNELGGEREEEEEDMNGAAVLVARGQAIQRSSRPVLPSRRRRVAAFHLLFAFFSFYF